MNKYTVKYTEDAKDDIVRLIEYIVNRENPDIALAKKAREAIRIAIKQLSYFPYNYRKVNTSDSYLREIIIPFTGSGYIAMYKIDRIEKTVTILALRHQREDDYH